MKEKSLKLRAAILLAIWSALADDLRTFLLGAHILELGHNPEFLRTVFASREQALTWDVERIK